jgi:hypothetical protein
MAAVCQTVLLLGKFFKQLNATFANIILLYCIIDINTKNIDRLKEVGQ